MILCVAIRIDALHSQLDQIRPISMDLDIITCVETRLDALHLQLDEIGPISMKSSLSLCIWCRHFNLNNAGWGFFI